MLLPNTPGVYAIVRGEEAAIYVGSAARSIRDRWGRHLRLLRQGAHDNAHLQAAWNHYGEAAFTVRVLELCAADGVIAAEQRWIDCYRVAGMPLYNICEVAGSRLGVLHTAETSRKLRKNAETFSLISPDGERFSDIPNLSQFCLAHGLDVSSVAKVIKGEHPHYKGWRRDEGGEPAPFAGLVRAYGARCTLTAPDGTTYTTTNLEAFCREQSLLPQGMRAVITGQQRTHRGWSGYREGVVPKTTSGRDALKRPRAFCAPDGTIHRTDNLYQLCKDHNLDKGAMLRLEAGKVQSHKGWRRAD